MKIEKGVTRIVFVFKNFVVKIPNFSVQHNHFLNGCLANWQERHYWKAWVGTDLRDMVAPTLFCSWFGLFQIQSRAIVLSNDFETPNKFEWFRDVCSDIKPSNFGYYKDRIVCIDYAA